MSMTTQQLRDKAFKFLKSHKLSYEDIYDNKWQSDLVDLLNQTIDETISFMDKFYWLSPKYHNEQTLNNYK